MRSRVFADTCSDGDVALITRMSEVSIRWVFPWVVVSKLKHAKHSKHAKNAKHAKQAKHATLSQIPKYM